VAEFSGLSRGGDGAAGAGAVGDLPIDDIVTGFHG
jgi:hypothetical protein